MKITEPRLLYFTAGVAVTDEDREAAFKITHNVGFRNASMKLGDKLEDTDAVAGAVPDAYKRAYFTVTTKNQLTKAAQARAEGKMPNYEEDRSVDDADVVVDDLVEPVEPDTSDKSDVWKAAYEDGKARKGLDTEATSEQKEAYEVGETYISATEAYAAAKAEADSKAAKAAKANKPKKPAKPPKWGSQN
jgi:hypothetical protein